jgi:hypothetical protein
MTAVSPISVLPRSLDIVQLIEKNPMTRFSDNKYQNRFIEKIKSSFSESQQQLFIASFYCYLNYGKKEFVVNLDNVWKWLGFSRKDPAKVVIAKHFVENIDFIVEKLAPEAAVASHGGSNKETILMNITTFKKLCLKSNTKKADDIHDYFIKLEEIIQDTVNEESEELKIQLSQCILSQEDLLQQQIQSQEDLRQQQIQSEKQKEALREKTILEHFPDNIQCIYYGFIDNKTEKGDSLIKFGNSNALQRRVIEHKKAFDNFRLVNAFRVENKIEMENELKHHPTLKLVRTSLLIGTQNQTELWIRSQTTEATEELDTVILDIITHVEFNRRNYSILLRKNENLTAEIKNLKQELSVVAELLKRHVSASQPLVAAQRRHASSVSNVDISFTERPITTPSVQPREIVQPSSTATATATHFNSDIVLSDNLYDYNKKKLRRINKNKDGVYVIGGESFPKLFGTREEVWNRKAYKTSGELTVADFVINIEGKIVSKSKCIRSKTINQFKLSETKQNVMTVCVANEEAALRRPTLPSSTEATELTVIQSQDE